MRALPATIVTSCIGWFILSSLWIYPHSLSYFNESVGGPISGPKHLLGSNVDWGQDLYYLIDIISKHKEASESQIHLAYFGGARAVDLGFPNTVLQKDLHQKGTGAIDAAVESKNETTPKRQLYCVSINTLMENQTAQVRQLSNSNRLSLSYLRTEQPNWRAGYSIQVYQVK